MKWSRKGQDWRKVPDDDEVMHKRRPASKSRFGMESMCGKPGYITTLWRNVTCPVCLGHRPPDKRRRSR